VAVAAPDRCLVRAPESDAGEHPMPQGRAAVRAPARPAFTECCATAPTMTLNTRIMICPVLALYRRFRRQVDTRGTQTREAVAGTLLRPHVRIRPYERSAARGATHRHVPRRMRDQDSGPLMRRTKTAEQEDCRHSMPISGTSAREKKAATPVRCARRSCKLPLGAEAVVCFKA
jgi:hypothetical protein